jgi:hypothetical protein
MEAAAVFILIFLFWGVVKLILAVGGRTVHAVGRAAAGKGTLSENLEVAFKGLGSLEVRVVDTRLSQEPDAPIVKEVQVKGLLPIRTRRPLGFVTSVFDNTSGTFQPVKCPTESFQEPHTLAYQHSTELGFIEAGIGFVSWIRVGVVLPQLLETPFGGRRNLAAVLRLIDLDNKPDIRAGYHEPDHAGLLWQRQVDFEYLVEGKGYEELEALRNEARTLAVKTALCIAMWDGSLGEPEGEVLRTWIQKVLSGYSGERRETVRCSLNTAMKEGYAAARQGHLNLTDLMHRLNEIGESASKYETIELCYDVLTAREVLNPDAAKMIDLAAKVLGLDLSEVEKIRDLRLVSLRTEITAEVGVEELLGMDPSWDTDRKKRHLRQEFQKWNNRLTTLSEGAERDNAQRMLDAISEVRQQYG